MVFREIARPLLLERLARGTAEPVTVLTPNHRLALALQDEVDRGHLAAGRAAWEAADILHFESFLERAHGEALHADLAAEVPALLTTHEEQLLWEEAVRASEWRDRVLSPVATAALAAEAWKLAHDWRIEGALDGWPANEDGEAFAAWRAHYRRRTERDRLVDAARLPACVAELFARGQAAAPAALVLYAFDLLTPRQSDFLEALAKPGVEVLACRAPAAATPRARRVRLESPRQELEWAARWARARWEAATAPAPQSAPKSGGDERQRDLFAPPAPASPSVGRDAAPPRIAIVVPDLQKRRAEVVRIFSRTLGPRGFNVSFAPPIAAAPLVDAALGVLELAAGPVEFDRASRLLRSPFVGGAETEMGARARLDVALRRVAPANVSLNRLRGLAADLAHRRGAGCPLLLARLDATIAAAAETSRAAPTDWARRFTAVLDAAGFPGERALDSNEFQALAKWREVLAALATLGSVAPAWNESEARARLRRLVADTTFQPASGTAPVQVLGVLESAGLAHDHLWVSGLTEEAWPIAARPHPLIAPALQRRAGIPQSTPELSLAVDAALTASWRESAPEVVFSSARADGDRELLASALVADVPLSPPESLAIPAFATRRDALFAAGRTPDAVVTRLDRLGPALAAEAVGGTAILVDQAACPFRAYAHFRLGARALERPEPGLGPRERGQLVHALMAHLWSELKDQATLAATPPERLATMIDAAAAHAVAQVRRDRPGRLEGRFAELERERLASIARDWLEVERRRAPFEVVLREGEVTLSAGNLRLRGRVDRMDRLVDGGGLAIIDYKTGSGVSPMSWIGERPDDAQLPLYALAASGEDVRAVAFARLKVGKLAFAGLSREADLLPEVKVVEKSGVRRVVADWDALLGEWRRSTASLGEDFAAGSARVDPKRMLATCDRCDLQPLCRVHERLGTLDEGDVEDEFE